MDFLASMHSMDMMAIEGTLSVVIKMIRKIKSSFRTKKGVSHETDNT